ncbi:LysR family transcriptional regulator substrate-binding protein [Micromonospora ureilytica]|uniref:LysR family transcriptional regulator substrate-binding protein n=1 Tax=Micromonospora ureilytica TaxID=709868 RepID=UPI002E0F6ECB|nr:LysR family transcriptional regulator substrate-binding protein [Micromonospora ureilytica]
MFFDGRVDGEVELLKLLDDPYLLVARRGTFPDGPVRLAQLDGAPMVAHPPICDQARMEQALARRVVRPHIVCRTAGNETVLSMVRAGMGSAVLPQLALHGGDVGSDESLRVHELKPALPPREIFLLWQANRTHSPLVTRTIEIAVDVAGKIAKRT